MNWEIYITQNKLTEKYHFYTMAVIVATIV